MEAINLGNKLKTYRKKLGITQSELASGIISTSYLSKIENEMISAPTETLELLFSRLNVELPQIYEQNAHYEQLCNKWFEELFNSDLENIIHTYKEIEGIYNLINDNALLTLVEIHKLRYFILINDLDKVEKQYQFLLDFEKKFKDTECYYWLKFKGYYHYINSDFKKALDSFLGAKDYLKYLKNEETPNLYYMIALSASRSRQLSITLSYTKDALVYFQKNYYLKECANCHILMGITYSRLKNYEAAIESYEFSIKIAKEIQNKEIVSNSLQNIGNLYLLLNNLELAIEYLINSYESRDGDKKRIVPVSSLLKLYFKEKDFKNSKKWYKIGRHIIDNNEVDVLFVYEFQVYNYLINDIHGDKLESLILDQVIPYLDQKNMRFEKIEFLELIADFYQRNRKYKLSSEYYKLALEILKSI